MNKPAQSCVDAMLHSLFSVQPHCLLSRVFVYSVLVFAFGLISTAEFRNSSSSERERERERGRVSKIGASRREDGASADNAVIFQVATVWSVKGSVLKGVEKGLFVLDSWK